MINVIGVGGEIDNLRNTDTGIWKPVEWNRNIVGYCGFQSNWKFNKILIHQLVWLPHWNPLHISIPNFPLHPIPFAKHNNIQLFIARSQKPTQQRSAWSLLVVPLWMLPFPPIRQKNDNCWCGSAANKYNTTLFKHIVKSSCLQQIARAAPKVVVVDYSCWDLSFVLPKLLRRCVIRPHLAWTVVDVVVVVSRIRQL